MKRLTQLFLLTSVLALTAAPALATDWPGFQSGLKPGRSSSDEIAKLPNDVNISKPGNDVPSAISGLSGIWDGWMCKNAAGSVSVAVENLKPAGGTMVYAFASTKFGQKPSSKRFDVKLINGNELQGNWDNATITIRQRPDGNMDIRWDLDANWCTGILAKRQ
jgi:hypothetical protein